MLNRYGPWMDTNVVVPDGPRHCTVSFDFWLDKQLCADSELISDSLSSSDQVWSSCPACMGPCIVMESAIKVQCSCNGRCSRRTLACVRVCRGAYFPQRMSAGDMRPA